jgi:hypothetical protein
MSLDKKLLNLLGGIMSKKSKEILMKSLICIGLGSIVLLAFIIPILTVILNEVDDWGFVAYPIMIIFFASGILFVILLPFYGSALDQKPVKAEKYEVTYPSSEPVLVHLENAIKRQGYELYLPKNSIEGISATFYCRLRYWTLVCISIVVVDELSKETIAEINRKYKQLIDEIYGSKKGDRVTAHISLFLIKKENAISHKLVNSNIVQRYQRFYLPAYILDSSGVFYIARQKSGFGTSKYRQLRLELREIMQRIKNS